MTHDVKCPLPTNWSAALQFVFLLYSEGTLYSSMYILIKKRRDITPTYTSILQLGVRSLPLLSSHNIPSLLDTSW